MLHPEVEFEAGMSAVPIVSVALIAACVVAFGVPGRPGRPERPESVRAMAAMDPALVKQGEVWRLLSAAFLHGNFDHILGNVIMLYILGMGCEHAFGRSQFLALYVASGLCGSLLSLTGGRVSVGASGAIFGLAGALVATLWRHRARLHVRDRRIGLLLVAWAGYQLFIGAMLPQVDNLAHLGGLLGGIVLGLVLAPAVLEGRAEVNARATTTAGLRPGRRWHCSAPPFSSCPDWSVEPALDAALHGKSTAPVRWKGTLACGMQIQFIRRTDVFPNRSQTRACDRRLRCNPSLWSRFFSRRPNIPWRICSAAAVSWAPSGFMSWQKCSANREPFP